MSIRFSITKQHISPISICNDTSLDLLVLGVPSVAIRRHSVRRVASTRFRLPIRCADEGPSGVGRNGGSGNRSPLTITRQDIVRARCANMPGAAVAAQELDFENSGGTPPKTYRGGLAVDMMDRPCRAFRPSGFPGLPHARKGARFAGTPGADAA